MPTMSPPLQTAHMNVLDVLAPLFCNGRSFSSLIDELSRHFKFEPMSLPGYANTAGYDGATGELEGSSESQSTDSEAEKGTTSIKADGGLVEERTRGQARTDQNTRTSSPPTAHSPPSQHPSSPSATTPTTPATTTVTDKTAEKPSRALGRRKGGRAMTGAAGGSSASISPASTRATRASLRHQKQSLLPDGVPGAAGPSDAVAHSNSTAISDDGGGSPAGVARGKGKATDPSAKQTTANTRRGRSDGRRNGKEEDASIRAPETPSLPLHGDEGTPGPANSRSGHSGELGPRVTPQVSAKGFINGDELTVLSVTVNADGWSEAVGAALATRARAGYVCAQMVEPSSPQSSEFVREVFEDERSGTQKALEVRTRLIPASQKVLLCSAWVDSGEYLAAAARLVAQCQAEVFGIACVRFEQNPSTQGLVDRFNLFAKSMPKGSVPSLNMGMKSCIPASLTKGFHGYTYRKGTAWTNANVRSGNGNTDDGADDSGAGGGGEAGRDESASAPGGQDASISAMPTNEARKDRSRKRRRTRSTIPDRDSTVTDGSHGPLSPEVATIAGSGAAAVADVPGPESMDEEEGGSPAGPAADEVSAGEGLADPGDGGPPAMRSGGGGTSEETDDGAGEAGASSSGGRSGSRRKRTEGSLALGRRGREMKVLGGAIFMGEEGDYAADSERSNDHESMHLCGGGGRESDDHESSERDVSRSVPGNGVKAGGSRTSRAASSSDLGANGDGESSGGRLRASTSSPKRRRIGGNSSSSSSSALPGSIAARHGSLRDTENGTNQREALVVLRSGVSLSSVRRSAGIDHGEEAEVEEEEGEEEEEEPEDAEQRACAGGGLGTQLTNVVLLQWKAKLGRQPIFMSRGTPGEGPSDLPYHSEGGSHAAGSAESGGGTGGLARRVQDPEDDRDRASSCSSIDSAVRTTATSSSSSSSIRSSKTRAGAGGIVRPGSRSSGSGIVGSDAPGEGGRVPSGVELVAPDSSGIETVNQTGIPPNTVGGAVPWHHTSVYEANDPTEDRHVELAHDALGVRIYCVCDGHGGSRAAQFVCDNLAADVLARVIEMADRDGRPEPGPGSEDSKGWTGDEAEIRGSLAKAFESCDERFIAQLDPKKNRGYINAGCCVVLALLLRSKLYVAHVGDCRVVLGTTDTARFPSHLLMSPSATTTTKAESPGMPAGRLASNTDIGRRDVGDESVVRARNGRREGRVAGTKRAATAAAAAAAAAAEVRKTLGAVALSRDHNCDNADEVALVRARSGDENAIRVSRNDEWKGARAIKRVAGSLAVTRAIGDAYLKRAVFSFSPYKEGVPYITAEPAVTAIELTADDKFIVLATDGVWEQISNEEAVHCVSMALEPLTGTGLAGGSSFGRSPAMSRRHRSSATRTSRAVGREAPAGTSDALVNFVLSRSAEAHGMSVLALRALPRGHSRRMLHDDVCATVVHLEPPLPSPPL